MRPLIPLRPAFLNRLAAARELGRRFIQGRNLPETTGAPPEEFEGHHPYVPGEDVRWIDWNLAARQDQLFVKVFRTDAEIETVLLVDASGSMTGGRGHKYAAAAAAAAALAWIALIDGTPVRLARYADRLIDAAGPVRRPEGLALLQELLATPPPPSAATNLASALDPILAGPRRPLAVVALTDCLEGPSLPAAIARALAAGVRRVSLVRVLEPADLTPRVRGNLLLLDPEGPGERRILADRDLEREAHRRIASHFQNLGEALSRRGVPLRELDVRRPFEAGFLAMLAAGTAPTVPA